MQNSWHCAQLTGWSQLQRHATRYPLCERKRLCKYRDLVWCTALTWSAIVFVVFFFGIFNAQRTDKEVPDWLKSIQFHSMIQPVISCRGIQIYGFRERISGSLLIATPMDLQFGLWCFCSVSIPTLRHEWYGMVKLLNHFQVNVSWRHKCT